MPTEMTDIEMLKTSPDLEADAMSGMSKFNNAEAMETNEKDANKKEELHRALTPAQISMIAIGGSIGTGLIISSGQALAQGGPASLVIGYLIMGWVCYTVLTALGEMSAFYPSSSIAIHASRYIDPAVGYGCGIIYLCKYLIITPNQLNASALLISYWRPDLSGGIFVSIFFIFIFTSNLCGVRWFGIFEYILSFSKIIVLSALIIGGFVVSLGANPHKDRIAFRYWKGGHTFKEYKETGNLGRFLGSWSVLTLALFAYLGSELVGVCAGETKDPRKSLPSAIKKTIWRIVWFYICGVIVITMLVSANNPRLTALSGKAKSTAAASPFVIAFETVGIRTLPSIINGALLIFTLSAANSDLYIASRTLYGLASEGKAPALFLKCTSKGVPYISLIFCSLFCSLAYLNVSSGGAQTFAYLTATVTIFGGLVWAILLSSHIRFMIGLKVQQIERDSLPYKAPFQPYASPIALFITILVLFFKGFPAFLPSFDYKSFITNYIGIPIFLFVWLGWKVYTKSSVVPASEMDFTAGRQFDVLGEGVEGSSK